MQRGKFPTILVQPKWIIHTHTHTHTHIYIYTIHGVTKSQTQLSDWTELNWTEHIYAFSLSA